MKKSTDKTSWSLPHSEVGTIRKDWQGRVPIAVVYPNVYRVGISNLGFQTVYRLLNDMEQVVCERVFLAEGGKPQSGVPRSVESGRQLSAFEIIAFSVSFEDDYRHILNLLKAAGLPLRADHRDAPRPLVVAGGVACFLNPEPISPFIDCFLMGEAEVLLPRFMAHYEPGMDKTRLLANLVGNMPGVYVPAFYRPSYHRSGTLSAFRPVSGAPPMVHRERVSDISKISTCSTVVTPEAAFESSFLVEVGRGCPHGCRFCSAGYIFRPPRFRPLDALKACLESGRAATDRIGLVGAAVSDLPGLNDLCQFGIGKGLRLSFSSLRADALSAELIDTLRQSGIKTATIAPDGGSERIRNVINKGLGEDHILDAAERLVGGGIPNLRMYFMVGLPTETEADIVALVDLCLKTKARFLASSRAKGRMGTITISVSTFVPKAFTPFQWAAMDPLPMLRKKIKIIRQGLRREANVRVHADEPRRAIYQGLIARGDRRVAEVLEAMAVSGINWNQALKESGFDTRFYLHRERESDELFPWDFIDHGIRKSFLYREYRRALEARPAPPCPESRCSSCGVCRDRGIRAEDGDVEA